MEEEKYSDYAPFILRVAAYIIDSAIVSTAGGILFAIFGGMSLLSSGILTNPESLSDERILAIALSFAGFGIFIFIGQWLYFALMESSKMRATIGKNLLGLEVTDLDGRRISFLRASGRYFGKIISAMIMYIGFLMAAFTEKRQALHDIMANCLVLKT